MILKAIPVTYTLHARDNMLSFFRSSGEGGPILNLYLGNLSKSSICPQL